MTPKMSIICPTYNNAAYLDECIQAFLAQTEPDFELVIANDFSTANDLEIIAKYNDPRLVVIEHPYWQGLNAGLTHAIEKARAPIIAWIASDDVPEHNYVERVLQTFAANPDVGVVYVSLHCIDENSQPLKREFRTNPNANRIDSLRTIFFAKNCLTSPGMAFKKSAIQPYLPLPLGLLQLGDVYMHVILLLQNQLATIDDFLVKYRRPTPKKAFNVSARSEAVRKRAILEVDAMMDAYLNIKDLEVFTEIFGSHIIVKNASPTIETIPFFLGMLALQSNHQPRKYWGYRTIMDFMQSPQNMDAAHVACGYNFGEFLGLIEKNGIEIIVNKKAIRFFKFLRKVYAPYDNFRKFMKSVKNKRR